MLKNLFLVNHSLLEDDSSLLCNDLFVRFGGCLLNNFEKRKSQVKHEVAVVMLTRQKNFNEVKAPSLERNHLLMT